MNLGRIVTAALLLIVVGTASARTVYVERWGSSDHNTCGGRSEPCTSLNRGTAVAGPNDWIAVGPG